MHITAENVAELFPDVDTSVVARPRLVGSDNVDLRGYDEDQIRLMDEVCIVVDVDDLPIGSASKKVCHLMGNIERGLLHRAFSVFLFDSRGRLLMQQRAAEKITFPNMWTNTCCSHPLAVPSELGSDLESAVQGVRRAAQRKLDHELGIQLAAVPLDKFDFLTRIHYRAASDATWGEHEVDYILFIQADVEIAPNANEVQATRYVTRPELEAMLASADLLFTPWFKLICQSMLFKWWDHMQTSLDAFKETQIRRM